jgi:hypothetical protein
MKKEILKAFLTIAVVSAASSAYAQVDITSVGSTIGAQSFKPSNNVTVRCVSIASAYAAQSNHSNGDRIFGVSFDDPKIYWKNGTAVETFDQASTWGITGWSSL